MRTAIAGVIAILAGIVMAVVGFSAYPTNETLGWIGVGTFVFGIVLLLIAAARAGAFEAIGEAIGEVGGAIASALIFWD